METKSKSRERERERVDRDEKIADVLFQRSIQKIQKKKSGRVRMRVKKKMKPHTRTLSKRYDVAKQIYNEFPPPLVCVKQKDT